jgi:hypothetical protein
MPAIPIVSGIFSDNGPDVRTGYPVNMMPVPKGSGVSQEYLRPADGIVALGEGPGVDRGGIEWNGVCYRVMGTKLVTVTASGAVTILGDVGGSGYVTFDYSFDRLAIASSGNLYYWNGATLTQVTDPDLGTVLDVVWVDGYFMTTDGEFLVVTELTDPTQVNPLKYGSSEVDPDPVVALLKSRNEIYALNRHTIEVFDNVGGSLFPFQRIDGAQIMRGTVGTFAACVFGDMGIAFLGSGRNEPPSIYLGANSSSASLATQDIDLLLQTYTEAQLAQVKVEARIDRAHQLLYVHLPDRTLVYDHAASQALNQRVWWTLTGGVDGFAQYPMRSLVWCYDKWIVGHTTTAQVGYLNRNLGSQWGAKARWEFSTPLVYNESKGAIFHELELVALPGRVALGINPQISTSYSTDGSSWSQDRFISVGTTGDTRKRLVWFQLGSMESFRVQRFRGDTDAHVSFLRLEARLEPLQV